MTYKFKFGDEMMVQDPKDFKKNPMIFVIKGRAKMKYSDGKTKIFYDCDMKNYNGDGYLTFAEEELTLISTLKK